MNVYHFHNCTGGGVLSVIQNLCKYSSNENIVNHIIHVLNKNLVLDYVITPIEGAATQQLFYYNPKNNFYYTCNQLAKLLPNNKDLIIAHDWIELGMVSNLGLQNPVVQILHGDFSYYYELAIKNQSIINAFICISPIVYNKLKQKIPISLNNIYYQNFPVPSIKIKNKTGKIIRLIYFVRDLKDDRKQFITIVKIAKELGNHGKDYFFTVAGGGMTRQEFFELWPVEMHDRVNFLGFKLNDEILEILSEQDIFLLPSIAEGFPISLVEAMKAGVIPFISNWQGAVDELVTNGITGFYFKIGASNDYSNQIKCLKDNKQLLNELSKNCIKKANEMFDPTINTINFEHIFKNASTGHVKKNTPLKVYGSRLDHPLIPNIITTLIRNNK